MTLNGGQLRDTRLDIFSSKYHTYWPADRRKIPDPIDFGATKSEAGIDDKRVVVFPVSRPLGRHYNICERTAYNMEYKQINKSTNSYDFRNYVRAHLQMNTSFKTRGEIDGTLLKFNEMMTVAPSFLPHTHVSPVFYKLVHRLSHHR